MRTALAIVAAVCCLAASPQHGRLFPPEQLGILEGPDRDAWQQPEKIMDELAIGEGSVVADLGAGGGWFTVRLAHRVGPNGRVYAEDVQRQMIEATMRRVAREGLSNVIPILGDLSNPHLKEPVDAVLIVDTYNEMTHRAAVLRNVAASLKPKGRLGIVDFKRDGYGPGPALEERVDPERIIRDAEAAGLHLLSPPTILRYEVPARLRQTRRAMNRTPAFFSDYQQRVEAELQRLIPSDGGPVHRAMAYTVHAPSKHVRPVLTLLSVEICGGEAARAVPVAAVIELVHASSLILDDLPSMDDAPLRRGKAANHRQHGEAMAILAAFGLLNMAFATLAREYDPVLSSRLAALIAGAVGLDGLIGGQALDLLATDQQISFETLERIHRGKTGALFSASAVAGALVAAATAEDIARLDAFARNLGLAFQIVDDLLDVEGDPAETGKAVRADLKKTTFVSFSGVAGARQLAGELCVTADRALAPFGRRADRLRELSAFVAGRSG